MLESNSCVNDAIDFNDLLRTNFLTISSILSFRTPQFTIGKSDYTSYNPSNSVSLSEINSGRLDSI